MSVTDDPNTNASLNSAEQAAGASAVKPSDVNLRDEEHDASATATGHAPDTTATSHSPEAQGAGASAAAPSQATHVPGAPTNPFEDTHTHTDQTPVLPPRPEAAGEEHDASVSPQVEALRAMFPDFDVAVLQSVLESVDNDQERALDILLGMSDPDYVSTQTAGQVQNPQQPPLDVDEQLARQLMLEDQQHQQRRRYATGQSWPRRGDEQVPYQPRQHAPENAHPPANEQRTDLQELQRTMGQIAESGKRTFSSIVSKVKAKINEYEQTRTVGGGQSSNASTMPQWGSAPPANVDRHTASQAYQQQYYGLGPNAHSQPPQPSPNAEPHQISLNDGHSQVQGYNLDPPAVQSQPSSQSPPSTSPIPTPAVRSTSPQAASGLSPAASPRPSSDVPRPPPTATGSPVNAAKIGLLPKRPVSLLNTNSPPASRPSDDDELEYVENPFEEHK
ncbi:hypothetical protein C8Q80DRAFT_1184470 [Daedaleopsis nitida]|nr:hypothetical protein C8Q80DRAFT_1184470 [Daedaleopsis nitida]